MSHWLHHTSLMWDTRRDMWIGWQAGAFFTLALVASNRAAK